MFARIRDNLARRFEITTLLLRKDMGPTRRVNAGGVPSAWFASSICATVVTAVTKDGDGTAQNGINAVGILGCRGRQDATDLVHRTIYPGAVVHRSRQTNRGSMRIAGVQ